MGQFWEMCNLSDQKVRTLTYELFIFPTASFSMTKDLWKNHNIKNNNNNKNVFKLKTEIMAEIHTCL